MLNPQEGHYILTEAEYVNYNYQIGKTPLWFKNKWFKSLSKSFEVEPGLIVRYPLTHLEPLLNSENNVDKHDNYFAYCCDRESARSVIKYGLKNFFHYDVRSWNLVKQRYGVWGAIKQYIACTRQPYQIGAYSLMGYGVCDPISYLHLLITICIEPFKEGTSGKKLLYLFSCNTRATGKPLGGLFTILMRIKHGKNWVEDMYRTYYKDTFPALINILEDK